MILDRLENASRYQTLHPLFQQAFAMLRGPSIANLSNGRHDLVGDSLFVVIDRGNGRGREQSMLEFHRKYIDIQLVISGTDSIGWKPLADCERISTEYDREKDLGFFFDRPDTWLSVPANTFAIFYPEDSHATLGGEGGIHKAIAKVAI